MLLTLDNTSVCTVYKNTITLMTSHRVYILKIATDVTWKNSFHTRNTYYQLTKTYYRKPPSLSLTDVYKTDNTLTSHLVLRESIFRLEQNKKINSHGKIYYNITLNLITTNSLSSAFIYFTLRLISWFYCTLTNN